MIQIGDIVLVRFPFADKKGFKLRPALVLAVTKDLTILAFITSNTGYKNQWAMALPPTPENGLRKPSVLRLNKLVSVDNKLIPGKIGFVADRDLEKTRDILVRLFKL